MTTQLIALSIALGVVNIVIAGAVVLNRLVARYSDRRYRRAVEQVRPIVLSAIAGDAVSLGVRSRIELLATGDLLAKYGRNLSGDGRVHVNELAERSGVIDALVRGSQSRRSWKRAACVYRLGDLGRNQAELLIVRLSDSDRRVRNAAARSLGKQRCTEGVRPIAYAFGRGTIARAVGAQALIDIGPPAADALARLLSSGPVLVQAGAAELLGRLGTVSHSSLLAEAMDHHDPEVRVAAVRALGRIGARSAAARILPVLGDPVPFVRSAAATALGALGSRDAIDALTVMAESDEYLPARAAAESAVLLGGRFPDPGPHLREAIRMSEVTA
ncbi:MAG: HEAT repeat domain-containing protein [Acidimicrobiia bacterium]|nr:HEAT repeat domain-containing protein [Acidimicrobiia bacterium]MDH4308882.1 HEAT repeat domain-containing protein [Acidimicrobiia bacterium]